MDEIFHDGDVVCILVTSNEKGIIERIQMSTFWFLLKVDEEN